MVQPKREYEGFGYPKNGKGSLHIRMNNNTACCDSRIELKAMIAEAKSEKENDVKLLTIEDVSCRSCMKTTLYDKLLEKHLNPDSPFREESPAEEPKKAETIKEPAPAPKESKPIPLSKKEQEELLGTPNKVIPPKEKEPADDKVQTPSTKEQPKYLASENPELFVDMARNDINKKTFWALQVIMVNKEAKANIIHVPSGLTFFEQLDVTLAGNYLLELNNDKILWSKEPKECISKAREVFNILHRRSKSGRKIKRREKTILPKYKLQRRPTNDPIPKKYMQEQIGTPAYTVAKMVDMGSLKREIIQKLVNKYTMKETKAEKLFQNWLHQASRDNGIHIHIILSSDQNEDYYKGPEIMLTEED